jgi:hypothetical protein
MTTIVVLGAGKVDETSLSGPTARAVALPESASRPTQDLTVVCATIARALRAAGNPVMLLHG